jgi:hypothetical protein
LSELHICGSTPVGKLWHTIRFSDHWQPFGDVKAVESNDPGAFVSVGCAAAGFVEDGQLHVCGVTSDGGLWHTIRFQNSTSWQPSFGNVKGVESNDPGAFVSVGCGSIVGGALDERDAGLHVCGVTSDGKLWHTIRFANGSGWQPFFGDVKGVESNDPGAFVSVGCAGYNDLHLCGVTTDGKLWHTIRFSEYGKLDSATSQVTTYPASWQPSFGDVKGVESNDPGAFVSVDCAMTGEYNLHVCGVTSDGKLWHTIRFANGSGWQPSFGEVTATQAGNPGPFSLVRCAAVGSDLHVCGITGDGTLWHTIRFADGSGWQPFGNVTQTVGSLGVQPGALHSIGMAGFSNRPIIT